MNENIHLTVSIPLPSRKILSRLLRWFLPNGGTLLIVAALLLTQNLWARPLAAINAPGPSATTVNYQGHLANSAGTALDGTYAMTFALYDAASNGTLIWGPESHLAVPVSDGLFTVGLGSLTAGGIPTSVWNGDCYLEITVGGETLTPREIIRSVPIAGIALTVPDRAITTEKIADGAITGAKQTVKTYYATDETVVTLQGVTTILVSHFQFLNVPAGDISVFITAVGTCSAVCGGTFTLVGPSGTITRIPMHMITAQWEQVALVGQIQNFAGGTLTIDLYAGGEQSNTQFTFGAPNDDRFGRRVMVIAGQ